jgi:hypothetical protein
MFTFSSELFNSLIRWPVDRYAIADLIKMIPPRKPKM